MKPLHIILAELAALAIIIYQARSEPTATVALRLPSGAQRLRDPRTIKRSTRKGALATNTVGGGAVEYREGGGLY